MSPLAAKAGRSETVSDHTRLSTETQQDEETNAASGKDQKIL